MKTGLFDGFLECHPRDIGRSPASNDVLTALHGMPVGSFRSRPVIVQLCKRILRGGDELHSAMVAGAQQHAYGDRAILYP